MTIRSMLLLATLAQVPTCALSLQLAAGLLRASAAHRHANVAQAVPSTNVDECIVDAALYAGSMHREMDEVACQIGIQMPKRIDIRPAKEALDECLAFATTKTEFEDCMVDPRNGMMGDSDGVVARGIVGRVLSWHMSAVASVFVFVTDQVQMLRFTAVEVNKVRPLLKDKGQSRAEKPTWDMLVQTL